MCEDSGICSFQNTSGISCPGSTSSTVGAWQRAAYAGSRYILVSCPPGYSKKGVDKVSMEKQECVKCRPQLDYILQVYLYLFFTCLDSNQ